MEVTKDSHTQHNTIVASRQHLRSATQQLPVVPRHQLSSYGWRAFCVAAPSVRNSLPDSLRDPIIGGNSFRQSLKTFLFETYWCILRFHVDALYKSTFYFLTMEYKNTVARSESIAPWRLWRQERWLRNWSLGCQDSKPLSSPVHWPSLSCCLFPAE